jgi:hypothetical protein
LFAAAVDEVTYLVNEVERRDLTDVVLVGHSWAGIPIAGAARRLAGRLRAIAGPHDRGGLRRVSVALSTWCAPVELIVIYLRPGRRSAAPSPGSSLDGLLHAAGTIDDHRNNSRNSPM